MGGVEPTGSARATGDTEAQPPRSALTDIADQTVLRTPHAPEPAAEPLSAPHRSLSAYAFTAATPTDPDGARTRLSPEQTAGLKAQQREFRVWLGEYRRRRVLVPYGENAAALTVEMHGARWLLAFTDGAAMARYARARGETDRAWPYRLVWGAAVLDAGVPACRRWRRPGCRAGCWWTPGTMSGEWCCRRSSRSCRKRSR